MPHVFNLDRRQKIPAERISPSEYLFESEGDIPKWVERMIDTVNLPLVRVSSAPLSKTSAALLK